MKLIDWLERHRHSRGSARGDRRQPAGADRRRTDARADRALDPRRLVALGTVAALLLLVVLTLVLTNATNRDRTSVEHVRQSIQPPTESLDETLDAITRGESMLQRAVVTTGDARNGFLTNSIRAGELATEAWTSYRSTALGLDGELELAATYEKDYAAGKAIAADVLVPILQSNEPGALSEAQITFAEQERADLEALLSLYDQADQSALSDLSDNVAAASEILVVGAVIAGMFLLLCGAFGMRMAGRVVVDRRKRSTAAELAKFEASMMRALEMADDDASAFGVASKAVLENDPDAMPSVIESDASQAEFVATVGHMACGVQRPRDCPATKAGAPLQFADSTSLDACPTLSRADGPACSVTCMPVSVAGSDMAVLQLTGAVGTPPPMTDEVRLVVRRVGERVTMLRAFARFELQASRDPLTGLFNRRSLEVAVERLLATGTPFSVAYADLDHFKILNDVHGHDAGDRALRAFATTLRTSLRPEDVCGRWGGEEFVVVFPGCNQEQARQAMERVRAALATDALSGLNAPVTVSVGISESDLGEEFGETVARADDALHRAKDDGRDQVVLWRPPATAVKGSTATTRLAASGVG